MQTRSAVAVLLLLAVCTSSVLAASKWTNLFYAYGIKSANNVTDVGPGDKLTAIYHDGPAKRVRVDSTDAQGGIESTTFDFPTNIYYLNMLSQDVCFFEHMSKSQQLLPNTDWTSILTLQGEKTINGIVCQEFVVPKGNFAFSLLYYFLNYLGNDSYELRYFQNKATGMPVRFSCNTKPEFATATTFDFVQFVPQAESFPNSTFTVNMKATCH